MKNKLLNNQTICKTSKKLSQNQHNRLKIFAMENKKNKSLISMALVVKNIVFFTKF